MSISAVHSENYSEQLQEKAERLSSLLQAFSAPALEVFASPPLHYRMRAEFKFWHEGDDCFYVMTDSAGNRVRMDQFLVA